MNYGIILSGGIGSRFGGDIPKQYIEINGNPIIAYTVKQVLRAQCLDELIIVADKQWHPYIKKSITSFCGNHNNHIHYALPGVSRQGSIYNGLLKCISFRITEKDNVLIHDAVRPLVSEKLLNCCLESLKDNEAVMPVISINDTIYQSLNGINVTGLLNRDTLYAGQAPEGFKLKRYFDICCDFIDEIDNIRGSSELAYKGGMRICMINGDISNFKITNQEDLKRFVQVIGRMG